MNKIWVPAPKQFTVWSTETVTINSLIENIESLAFKSFHEMMDCG